jgi:DNA-binding PadR family transcriptional regulator
MKEIEARTGGAVELGPGTLYRSIKQLLTRGFILEVPEEPKGPSGAERRRRAYALTPAGKKEMAEEAQRLRDLVQWAEEQMVLEGGG